MGGSSGWVKATPDDELGMGQSDTRGWRGRGARASEARPRQW
jgi:hypothetical protein